MNRLVRAIAALVLGSVVLSGCEFDVYELPLPGGADVGDDAMTLEVEFESVLDLVPQSSVKVSDVTVGNVTDVELEGYTAVVTLEVRADTKLPANATATIRQTSLLGEKFVSLDAPESGASTTLLADGDTIPVERTGKNPEVEEVFGALSMLLNGGGIAKFKTIAQEVNLALEGREDSVKSVLQQIAVFMGQLDTNKADIVDAIESLNRLAVEAREQQPSINRALDELPSALLSIDRQRDDLVRMLQALARLSDVGVRVIQRSKESTISALTQLQPTLTQLANSGDDLVNSFNVILTYPFVDEVVGRDPQVARNLHMGDYTNLSAQLDLDFGESQVTCVALSEVPPDTPLAEIVNLPNLCESAVDRLDECLDGLVKTPPSIAGCRGLPTGIVDAVCESSPNPIPVLCGPGGGGGGPGLPIVPEVPLGSGTPNLPGVPGLGGGGGLLNRPAAGPSDTNRGPTMGQLMQAFDPALVSLLTPGMVTR